MLTRNSARLFGVNITNMMDIQLEDKKKMKIKRVKSIYCNQWIQNHPEISPYMEEITLNTRNHEHQSYILDNFMTRHTQITIRMREQLNGWLICIQPKLSLNHHTLYLTVFIIDKYCCNNYISNFNYQLLGVAAMFIAAKYEEIKTPKLKHYHNICEGTYSMQQILHMQSQILISLNFKIKSITSCWHLQEYMEYANIKNEYKIISQYILDLSLIQYVFCFMKPSVISWAIIIYILRAKKGQIINPKEVADNYQLCKQQLEKSLQMIANLFNNRKNQKFRQVNQKYKYLLGNLIL